MVSFESDLVQKAREPASLPEPSTAELPAQESPAPSTTDPEDID